MPDEKISLKEAAVRLVEAAEQLQKLASKLTGLGLIGFFVKDAAEKRVEDGITVVKAALRREGEKRVVEGKLDIFVTDLILVDDNDVRHHFSGMVAGVAIGHRVRITIEKLEDK